MSDARKVLLATQPENAKSAIKAFEKELDWSSRVQLTQEVAESRSADLALAHPGLVAVTYGLRLKQYKTRDGLSERLFKSPVVVLLVDKKWPRNATRDEIDSVPLPRYLFTHWGTGDQRRLVGVPTDVRELSEYEGIELQALAGVCRLNASSGSNGSTTCAIQIEKPDGTGSGPYLLSCAHVLSWRMQAPSQSGAVHYGHMTTTTRPGEKIGNPTKFRGYVNTRSKIVFDAQLADITDRTKARLLLPKVVRNAEVELILSSAEFNRLTNSAILKIHIPNGPVKRARYVGRLPSNLAFSYTIGSTSYKLYHAGLIELKVIGGVTKKSHSGSPVLIHNNGKTYLAGMHMGGVKGKPTAFMLPCWRLFNSGNYPALKPGEKLQLAAI